MKTAVQMDGIAFKLDISEPCLERKTPGQSTTPDRGQMTSPLYIVCYSRFFFGTGNNFFLHVRTDLPRLNRD